MYRFRQKKKLAPFSLIHPTAANPNGPPSHWSHISLVLQLAPTHHPFHWSPLTLPPSLRLIGPPISLVPPRIGPFSLAGPPPHCLNSLVPHLIGSPTLPFLPCSHWSPISLVPPIVTLSTLSSLVPHLIGPPMLPFPPCSHWSPISLVPRCNPGYAVLIGPPSHWSPSLTPSTLLFSLVPHLIGPPV